MFPLSCFDLCFGVYTAGISIPYLRAFTATKIAALKKYKHANIPLPNGWYTVLVLAGLTRQNIEIKKTDGALTTIESMEPAFEFLLTPVKEQPGYSGDIMYRFSVESE
jgi:hypothetical protein